jgi:arylsulfatase A-like enzyme
MLASAFTAAANGANDENTIEKPPNILFVLIDDMGYADLSVTGNNMVETQNIDAIAAAGTLFTQFYVSSPVCSPSRVAFTTGQFPSRHGINSYLASREHNIVRDMVDYLNPATPSIARALRERGYRTAHFGKWHMGGGRDVGNAPLPADYGFDEALVAFEGLGERVLPIEDDLSLQSEALGNGPTRRVLWRETTPIYVDRAIRFIGASDERPFYLQLWLNDVHSPWAPSYDMVREQFASHPGGHQQRFNAMLKHLDRELGRLFVALDELELAEDTLLLITSDNGPTVWHSYYTEAFGAPPGDTSVFRGRKSSLYEGGIRMPLIVRWPGKVTAGRVDDDSLLAAVDFYKTLLALAGNGQTPSASWCRRNEGPFRSRGVAISGSWRMPEKWHRPWRRSTTK